MAQDPDLTRVAAAVRDWARKKEDLQCVWFFGSRVKGSHRPDSDLDIALGFGLDDNESFNLWWDLSARWKEELALIVPHKVQLELLDGQTPRVRTFVREASILVFERSGCECRSRLLD